MCFGVMIYKDYKLKKRIQDIIEKNAEESLWVLGGLIGISAIAFAVWKVRNNKNENGYYANRPRQKMFFFNVSEGGGIHRISAEQVGDHYKIRVAGRPVGMVFPNPKVKAGWDTNNTGLADKMPVIGPSLTKALSKIAFSDRLKKLLLDIYSVSWRGSDTLEVVLNKTADLDDFKNKLKPHLQEFNEMDGLADLMVRLQHETYFKIMKINSLDD